jgi:CRP/FNR family transcriptional regulator
MAAVEAREGLRRHPTTILPVREEAHSVTALHELRAHCRSCSVRALCLPGDLDDRALRMLDEVIHVRMRVRRKSALYRPGERFGALYAIRLGTFKTTVLAEDGREQVTGYHMAGEIIGLDGIGDDRYTCEATALEDSEVCVLPWSEVDRLAADLPGLRRNVCRTISRDVSREQTMMLLLGSRSAGERLAHFLLNVSERYSARGYSSREFVLRMTREEIASYLGLKLETVSRLFSSLQEHGFIQVQGRAVKLLDAAGLRRAIAERD